MKRTNKKGFAIVELVVVIAVIAILSAVLIPTFSGITGRAKDEALNAELKAVYTQYATEKAEDDEDVASVVYIEYDGKYYMVENGDTADRTEAELPECNKSFVGGRAFEKLADAHAYDGDADTDCNNCGAARS